MSQTTLPTSRPAADAASTRVSIRRYQDQPISNEEIAHIVELAGKAPSAWNLQPWRFVAVTDPATKLKLQEAAFGQPQVGAAPVVFVVTSDIEASLATALEVTHPGMPEDKRQSTVEGIHNVFNSMTPEARNAWGRGQTNIAIGYLLLILESLGYGSSPMLGFNPAAVRQVLGLADHVEIPALVAVGRPAEAGFPQHRLPVDRILTIV